MLDCVATVFMLAALNHSDTSSLLSASAILKTVYVLLIGFLLKTYCSSYYGI